MKTLTLILTIAIVTPVLAEDPVRVDVQPDGSGATVGVDVLSVADGSIWGHAKRNWWKYALAAGAAYGADALADNNGWWWRDKKRDESKSAPAVPQVQSAAADYVAVSVSGEGNTVSVTLSVDKGED
jgi:hypothetical protein